MSFGRCRRLPRGRRSCASRRRRSRRFGPERRNQLRQRRSTSTKETCDVHCTPALGSVLMSTNALPQQSDDFPAWYGEVVRRAGLAENSTVRGAMVIKPYGYAIWESIQLELDERIKDTGHENVYFPLLLPASAPAPDSGLGGVFAPAGAA